MHSLELCRPSELTGIPEKQGYKGESKLKDIRRALQHNHGHRKSLGKVFNKWDRGMKGELDSSDIAAMVGELGVHVTDEEAK